MIETIQRNKIEFLLRFTAIYDILISANQNYVYRRYICSDTMIALKC